MHAPVAESRSDPLHWSSPCCSGGLTSSRRRASSRAASCFRPGRACRSGSFAPRQEVLGRPNPAVDLFPDPIKSWDVLRTIEAVSSSVEREAPVLDVGSVASAVLPCLHALGYRKLTGIDLDERVESMLHADEIEYAVEDLTRTTRPDGSFAAITAISVIEHGVEDEALLAEIARLLRPGGIFVFSTDYWPEKVDTDGVLLFRPSLADLQRGGDRGAAGACRSVRALHRVSDPRSRIREVDERAVRFGGRSYTFLYGVLVRA